MAYKPRMDEIAQVENCFENNKTILTQKNIIEQTNLPQPAVSEALKILEQKGKICWERMEGVNKVKYYNWLAPKGGE